MVKTDQTGQNGQVGDEQNGGMKPVSGDIRGQLERTSSTIATKLTGGKHSSRNILIFKAILSLVAILQQIFPTLP